MGTDSGQVVGKKSANYEEFEAESLKRPGIRKEYDALKPKYDIVRNIIERSNQPKVSQAQLARVIRAKKWTLL